MTDHDIDETPKCCRCGKAGEDLPFESDGTDCYHYCDGDELCSRKAYDEAGNLDEWLEEQRAAWEWEQSEDR